MRSSHKHQMSRHDLTTGDRHKGGCFGRVEAPVAFNKHQDRSALRGRAGCMTPPKRFAVFIGVLPVELGRAFGLGHLSRGWACTPDDLASFRVRIAAGLTPEQAGALQSIPDQSIAERAVRAQVHVERLSCVALDDEQHSERQITREQVPFASGATSV